MAYQLPTEIQHMIWTYSMYYSAKGLGFRKQIQEGWFKLRLRRLSNALETKSQHIYHQELGQLLLSMDELLNLPGEMRLKFIGRCSRYITPNFTVLIKLMFGL